VLGYGPYHVPRYGNVLNLFPVPEPEHHLSLAFTFFSPFFIVATRKKPWILRSLNKA